MLVGFFSTALAILALRGWATDIGLVDRPYGRKTHQGHIPLVGGLAIAVSFVAVSPFAKSLSVQLAPLVAATLLVVTTGLVDDLRPLSALSRFFSQIAAAVVMVVWGGLVVSDVGNLWGAGEVHLNGSAVAFTIFCAVGIMNAMNMIDGLDGLAGGVGVVALFWLCLGGQAAGLERGAELACLLLSAVGGFLLFNLPLPWRRRATVFLGDAGSLLLGFLLAWCSIDLSQNSLGKFYAMSTVWILGVPIMDTVYIMLRRMARGGSPFVGDRRHIHHALQNIGLSAGETLAVLIGMSVVFGGIGYLGWFFRVPETTLCFSFLGVFLVYCVLRSGWRPLFRLLGLRILDSEPSK